MEDNCRFCGSTNIFELVSFTEYPIFIGCSDLSKENDETYSFNIFLCENCLIIQQISLPPLEILYQERRAFGIGRKWKDHYDTFFNFIREDVNNAKNIMEVGGGNGILLEKINSIKKDTRIFDIEPDPFYKLGDVITIRKYFDKDFFINENVDLIYCSHLIEHLANVNEFFAKSFDVLNENGSLVTACPNILESFKQTHLNAFTTDHFNYFTPTTLTKLAEKHGFFATNYYQFSDHGMYLKFRKNNSTDSSLNFKQLDLVNIYKDYEKRISLFASYINSQDITNYYLFGAHAFSITFLRFLESSDQVKYILDNEPTKENRRLCGTDLIVKKPSIIEKDTHPIIVIYMGSYTNEICEQLQSLNKNVTLFRLDGYIEDNIK